MLNIYFDTLCRFKEREEYRLGIKLIREFNISKKRDLVNQLKSLPILIDLQSAVFIKGSFYRMDATPNSDLDIGVISSKSNNTYDFKEIIRELNQRFIIPVSLTIFDVDTISITNRFLYWNTLLFSDYILGGKKKYDESRNIELRKIRNSNLSDILLLYREDPINIKFDGGYHLDFPEMVDIEFLRFISIWSETWLANDDDIKKILNLSEICYELLTVHRYYKSSNFLKRNLDFNQEYLILKSLLYLLKSMVISRMMNYGETK